MSADGDALGVDLKKLGQLGELGSASEQLSGGKLTLSELMSPVLEELLARLKAGDALTWGITASTVMVSSLLVYTFFFSSDDTKATEAMEPKKKEVIVPRDFTLAQLRDFDGQDDKKIYISLKHEVFDVSSAKHMYGPDGGYHCFAGREASRAMGKLSFDEVDLANPDYSDLSPFEKSTLNDWIEKFKYFKDYPIVGRVSFPPTDLTLTKQELLAYKGGSDPPQGRIDAPIYVSVRGDIFDVSYGGKEMYGPESTYVIFTGIDASRALAKMSFKPEDLASDELSDLAESELKVLGDWHAKFKDARKYPIVGRLVQ